MCHFVNKNFCKENYNSKLAMQILNFHSENMNQQIKYVVTRAVARKGEECKNDMEGEK